jgi:hypothetical protein
MRAARPWWTSFPADRIAEGPDAARAYLPMHSLDSTVMRLMGALGYPCSRYALN